MNEIKKLIDLFQNARAQGATDEHLDELATAIQQANMKSYAQNTSFVARRNKVSEFEMGKWKRLEAYVTPSPHTKLFDSAFGSGRDIIIANELGYDAYGCELSDFLYDDFLFQSGFSKKKLVKCDLRSIPFSDGMFDVVRHNASFLHMPIIGKGYTAHRCLQESRRILKDGGYLYVYMKEGEGFVAIDTAEGLGARSFQLYNEQTLGALLHESGFDVLEYRHYARERNDVCILWIEAFAQKGSEIC